MTNLARALGVIPLSWERDWTPELTGPALTALGAWVIMAWNRLGIQGIAAPRAGVRFLLIGLYTWAAMTLLLWLLVRAMTWGAPASGPGQEDQERAPGPEAETGPETPHSLRRLAQLTGLAHRPLVVVAIMLQVLAVLVPTSGVGLVVAIVGLGAWMPAMLTSAIVWSTRSSVARAGAIVAVAYGAWLATAGHYLFDQVGHLL